MSDTHPTWAWISPFALLCSACKSALALDHERMVMSCIAEGCPNRFVEMQILRFPVMEQPPDCIAPPSCRVWQRGRIVPITDGPIEVQPPSPSTPVADNAGAVTKKYEHLIEMAFQYMEVFSISDPWEMGRRAFPAYDKLKAAVDALKEYRAASEPIFVLRGHDRVAPFAVRAWGHYTANGDVTEKLRDHASREHDRMLAWQEAHPDLVKMPD